MAGGDGGGAAGADGGGGYCGGEEYTPQDEVKELLESEEDIEVKDISFKEEEISVTLKDGGTKNYKWAQNETDYYEFREVV